MKVVAFNGSARKDGNTSIMLKIALEEINSEGIQTELINLAGNPIHGCVACYKCFQNKDMKCAVDDDLINDYILKMRESEGIILGSPTYFSDISTNMKALIERCGMVARANNHMLKRKIGAAVITVRRAGAIHAFSAINYFFLISQMIVPGSSYWNIAIGREPGDVNNDDEGIQTIQTLGKNISWLIKKIYY